MKVRQFLFVALLLGSASSLARAEERVGICFNYGCAADQSVLIRENELLRVEALFGQVSDPVSEREVIAHAVAKLYRYAGGQTPVFADRAGNLLDAGVEGRMDCIDHSTTTTRFLRIVERKGWLRHHRVADPARRTRFLFQHLSAVIEEVEGGMRHKAAGSDGRSVPDHVPVLLALCDCPDVIGDLPATDVGAGSTEGSDGKQFVVDSWFVDHGEPAVILPLAEWLKGGGPNVY